MTRSAPLGNPVPIARRLTVVAVIVAASMLTFSAPASARGRSPVERLDRFAFTFTFTFELTHTDDPSAPVLSVQSQGTFVGPDRQDCATTMRIGTVELSERAVIVGRRTWIESSDGKLERASARDFTWEAVCPSSSSFWSDFALAPPNSAHGRAEVVDGADVERFDIAGLVSSVQAGGFLDGIPADATFERAVVWRATQSRAVVGVDLSVVGGTQATCEEIVGESFAAVTAPCRLTIVLHLTRLDNRKIVIDTPGAGRTPLRLDA
jgi:hypothetical protein